MANYFSISGLNSFDWYLVDPVLDPSYNTIPREYDRRSYNPNGTYHQKWQTNDAPPTQLLSDFTPTMKFYKCGTNLLYRTVALPIVANSIIGVSFKSYQNTVDFSDWATGKYYGEITYTDDNANPITYRTSPIDLAVKHQDTIKIEYQNTLNTQNILFQAPNSIELMFRVEGWIAYIDPESDTELYTDQEHNVTEEDSIPYFNDTLYIGGPKGIPEWAIKKTALIMTMDQKKFDGQYYEKASSDAKFTPTRPENTRNTDAYWSIPVIRNEDFFIEGLVVGDNPEENDLQVIVKAKKYLLNGGDIVMANVLNDGYYLAFIQITNRSLTAFNVLVGTSIGGMELGVYGLSGNIVDTLIIQKGFRTPTTLYLTGLTGHDTDVRIEYHYLDDNSIIPNSGVGGFIKNVLYPYYELSDGDFETDFNVATGLGNTGTKFEGCALMDGRNGTVDLAGISLIGWDRTLSTTRQTVIGATDNLVTIDRNHLPSEGIEMFANSVNIANGDTPGADDHVTRSRGTGGSSANLNYEMSKANVAVTDFVGRTKNMGNGAELDITPMSLVTAWFIKLAD